MVLAKRAKNVCAPLKINRSKFSLWVGLFTLLISHVKNGILFFQNHFSFVWHVVPKSPLFLLSFSTFFLFCRHTVWFVTHSAVDRAASVQLSWDDDRARKEFLFSSSLNNIQLQLILRLHARWPYLDNPPPHRTNLRKGGHPGTAATSKLAQVPKKLMSGGGGGGGLRHFYFRSAIYVGVGGGGVSSNWGIAGSWIKHLFFFFFFFFLKVSIVGACTKRGGIYRKMSKRWGTGRLCPPPKSATAPQFLPVLVVGTDE